MVVHPLNDAYKSNVEKSPVNLAQELAFYLRNSEVDANSYGSKGLLSSRSFISRELHSDGLADIVVEFLFMENIRE